jgi:hypothetical protein
MSKVTSNFEKMSVVNTPPSTVMGDGMSPSRLINHLRRASRCRNGGDSTQEEKSSTKPAAATVINVTQ